MTSCITATKLSNQSRGGLPTSSLHVAFAAHIPQSRTIFPSGRIIKSRIIESTGLSSNDEGGQGQRLYFNDVDKPFPRSKTLEFVSLRLRQRYAIKNILRWLQMEGNIASYKNISYFLQIYVSRFGEHDTLK